MNAPKSKTIGTIHLIESSDGEEFLLQWIDKTNTLDPSIKEGMIETFTQVYPKLVKRFNPVSSRTVTFEIDDKLSTPGCTLGDRVRFSSDWFRKCPNDLDVVTHEIMHVVQDYGSENNTPSWIVEGLADYAREKYGLCNHKAGWTIPSGFQKGHHYTNSYRITARFFAWIEENALTGAKILEKLDIELDFFCYSRIYFV